MKKLMVAVSVFAALILASCGNSQDSNGWYSDFDSAKKMTKEYLKEFPQKKLLSQKIRKSCFL